MSEQDMHVIEYSSKRIVDRLGQDVRKWFENYLNEGVPLYEDFGYVKLFGHIQMAHLRDSQEGLDPIRSEDVRHVRNHISTNPNYIITDIGGIKHPQDNTERVPVSDPSHSVRHERSLRDQIYHIERLMNDMDNHRYYPSVDGDYLEYGITGWDGEPVKWTISPLLKHNKQEIDSMYEEDVINCRSEKLPERDRTVRRFYAKIAMQLKDLVLDEVTERMNGKWEDAQ